MVHIGVGSNVACSAELGNAKTSKTWDRQSMVPTSFLCLRQNGKSAISRGQGAKNGKCHIKVMRCKNCGWENPDNVTRCEKCNTSLGENTPSTPLRQNFSEEMKKTVSEGVVFNDAVPAPKTCPKCGYPLGEGVTSCPNCNFELQPTMAEKKTKTCRFCGAENAFDAKFCSSCGRALNEGMNQIRRPKIGATVMGGPISNSPAQKDFCTLKPIAWEGEERNYEPITYSGETIVLNRSNTDANNNSITSGEQAILTHKDGEWYIENRSELRSTFIRVNGRLKLNSGDIIVLGNREFEFKG